MATRLPSFESVPQAAAPPSSRQALFEHARLLHRLRRRGVRPHAGDCVRWPDGTVLYIFDPSRDLDPDSVLLVREVAEASERLDGLPTYVFSSVSPTRDGGALWLADAESRLVGRWPVGSERPRWYRAKDRPSAVMEADDGSLLVHSTVPSTFRQYDLRDGALVERRQWVLPAQPQLAHDGRTVICGGGGHWALADLTPDGLRFFAVVPTPTYRTEAGPAPSALFGFAPAADGGFVWLGDVHVPFDRAWLDAARAAASTQPLWPEGPLDPALVRRAFAFPERPSEPVSQPSRREYDGEGAPSGDYDLEEGRTLLSEGKTEEALTYFKRCLARAPDDGPAAKHAALALMAQGRAKDAARWLSVAKRAYADDSWEHRFSRAEIAALEGDRKEAVRRTREMLALDETAWTRIFDDGFYDVLLDDPSFVADLQSS